MHCSPKPKRFADQRKGIAIPAVIFVLGILLASAAQAQTFQVLHTFSGHGDGTDPIAGLTMGRDGNFYGTTAGGPAGGAVFKLSHVGAGWILNTLHVFQGRQDGASPEARVVFGPDGTLYGTTTYGGSHDWGTVFNLRPPAASCRSSQCPWSETVIYSFTGGSDGGNPEFGDLAFDSAGNIYGTTSSGGLPSCICGVVFKLSRSGQGWTESVVYDFTGGVDGAIPYSGVTFDSAGNLYGTTTGGGYGGGTAYELMPSESGWTETTLHTFGAGGDGCFPFGGVVLDRQGNLYGTTDIGGSGNGDGTVYELQPSGGTWNYSILYSFQGGGLLFDAPTLDGSGNLYGTTYLGGAYGNGSVFKLTPGSNGWSYTDLYDFSGFSDGGAPSGSVTLESQGNVYGTTTAGGNNNNGVVFEITQ